tara:strand:- start:953 stop:2086 length:1134 start_codon:yes stop_codon:yes gene_type:complete
MSDFSATHTPLEFRMDNLEVDMSLAQLVFDGTDIGEVAIATHAVLFMKVSHARSIFKIQTDSIDVDGVYDSTDTKYYIDVSGTLDDPSFIINPMHAMMDISATGEVPQYSLHASKNAVRTGSGATGAGTDLSDVDMLVKHDSIRYFLKENYGGTLGSQMDLLDDEDEIKLLSAVRGVALAKVLYTKFKAAHDASPLTDASNGSDNMTRVIMEHIISEDPGRLEMSSNLWNGSYNTYVEGQLQNFEGIQPVPFVPGDVISFKLTVGSNASQPKIDSIASPTTTRDYLIKLCLIEDGSGSDLRYVNTVPNDETSASGDILDNLSEYFDTGASGDIDDYAGRTFSSGDFTQQGNLYTVFGGGIVPTTPYGSGSVSGGSRA